MKEVYLISEDLNGVIGVAETLKGVLDMIIQEGWVIIKDFNFHSYTAGEASFINELEEKHGIFLKKMKLWG